MDFDDETKELEDDVLEGFEENMDDEDEDNPLIGLSSNESAEEDEDEDDEDEIDDAKLFGGVDDEDEGYNPLEDANMDDWS